MMIEDHNINAPTENPRGLFSRRLFFRQSGAFLLTTTLLSSCGKLAEEVVPETETPEPEPPKPVEEVTPERDKTLAFFGDSLTIGAGGTVPYAKFVGDALPGRPIVTDGIVGQVASRIAVRQGGVPLKITIEGNKLNSIQPIKITKLSNLFLSTPSRNEEYSRVGTIQGVRSTIRRNSSAAEGEMYTIAPTTVSMIDIPADSVFVLEDAAKLKTATQILWYGRNNIGEPGAEAEIMSSLECSIAYITAPARYLVLGVLTEADENKGSDNYNLVTTINGKLAAKYGEQYVKMTPPTDAEMAAISYTPTPEDLTDLANLNFPRGMRADIKTDDIHLNDKGYQIVANRVIERLKALKY